MGLTLYISVLGTQLRCDALDLTKDRRGTPAATDWRQRMILHDVRVHPSRDNLEREEQLAWKIAAVAADKVPVQRDVAAMIINRMIDNAAVAMGAINRRPVVSARDMALGHPSRDAATVFGVPA